MRKFIGLNTNKFSKENKDSSDLILFDFKDNISFNKKLLSFPAEADTQSFRINNNDLFLLHHTPHKSQDINVDPVSIYKMDQILNCVKRLETFSNSSDLSFPTSLAISEKYIVVGVNGQDFVSKVYVYSSKDRSLLHTIDYSKEHQLRPILLEIVDNYLYVGSYSSSNLSIYDLGNSCKELYTFNTREILGVEAPMSIKPYRDGVVIAGHLSCNLVFFSLDGFRKVISKYTLLETNGAPWDFSFVSEGLIVSIFDFSQDPVRPALELFTLDERGLFIKDRTFEDDHIRSITRFVVLD